MIITEHESFRKAYQKRIVRNQNLAERTKECIRMFVENPRSPLLGDHALSGKRSHLRAFSITGNVRIVYFPITEGHVLFLDIGTHPQVY